MLSVVTVDDERAVKQSLRKIIQMWCPNYEVVGEAEDGLEALELVRQLNPQLIITDITMPIMNGLELIELVREYSQSIDIIVLSGYDDFKYAQEALRFGVKDYLLKPMNHETVSSVLNKMHGEYIRKHEAQEKYRKCLWICRNVAEKLVDQMWQLDEAGLEDGIEAIDRHVADAALTDENKSMIYYELSTFIENELQVKSGANTGTSPSIRRSMNFSQFIRYWTEVIRGTRNWGKRLDIQNAIRYIKDHYADVDLSLQHVIRHVGMSPAYFYKMFKEESGVSFITYLIQLRIEKAQALLLSSKYKTYEIGEMIGYPDYPHFTKLFKKVVGLSPNDYRKTMGMK